MRDLSNSPDYNKLSASKAESRGTFASVGLPKSSETLRQETNQNKAGFNSFNVERDSLGYVVTVESDKVKFSVRLDPECLKLARESLRIDSKSVSKDEAVNFILNELAKAFHAESGTVENSLVNLDKDSLVRLMLEIGQLKELVNKSNSKIVLNNFIMSAEKGAEDGVVFKGFTIRGENSRIQLEANHAEIDLDCKNINIDLDISGGYLKGSYVNCNYNGCLKRVVIDVKKFSGNGIGLNTLESTIIYNSQEDLSRRFDHYIFESAMTPQYLCAISLPLDKKRLAKVLAKTNAKLNINQIDTILDKALSDLKVPTSVIKDQKGNKVVQIKPCKQGTNKKIELYEKDLNIRMISAHQLNELDQDISRFLESGIMRCFITRLVNSSGKVKETVHLRAEEAIRYAEKFAETGLAA